MVERAGDRWTEGESGRLRRTMHQRRTHNWKGELAVYRNPVGAVLGTGAKRIRGNRHLPSLAIENAVLQAFRVVEAITGEPGKNEPRFRAHLQDHGIDYDERVGFSGKPMKKRCGWRSSATTWHRLGFVPSNPHLHLADPPNG